MKLRHLSLLFVITVLILAALAATILYPYAGFSGETFVDIPKGMSTRDVAQLLETEKVIVSRWPFLAARMLHPGATLKAGEYRFASAASIWEVFSRIARGDVFYYELTVREGNNVFDIANELDRLSIIGPADFLQATRKTEMIRDLDPDAPTLEGYLFPSTYRVTRHTTAEQLCRRMTDQFRKVWKGLDGRDARTTITLASLVEKETAVAKERPLVASVYQNRLDRGMPLQCDPTTIYAALLEDRYQGAIYRTDLTSSNPYNTYAHPGLPPGPIANPGKDAIEAAVHPANTSYLYFVAKPDGSGTHQFSKDLADHQRAVQKYRRGLLAKEEPKKTHPATHRRAAHHHRRRR